MFCYKSGLNKNNKGSTFLLVTIIVMFVAIIGIVVLGMSSDYLVNVLVDRNSTSNFYDAETILTEVRTGLQEYAADSSKEVFEKIMENYNDTGGETREDIFSKLYFKTLSIKLGATDATTWDGITEKNYNCDEDIVKKLTTKPDAVSSKPGTNLFVTLKKEPITEKYEMALRSLFVDYEDANGYRTTISTDIIIHIPEYHFDGDTTFNELKKYIVITDNSLSISNASGSGHLTGAPGATFTGNIYTGKEDNAIQVEQHTKAIFNSDLIISRGDFNILTGSDVDIRANDGYSSTDLWLPNFKISSNGVTNTALYSDVRIHANSYIANDFIINDDYSVVKLGGNYYGYSYNEENTETTSAHNADFSSAFLINGVNTTLLTPNLNRLILAGRAFISRHNSSGVKDSVSDIMMGESLAIRSNQIAYLVPNEYITVDHNPVLSVEDNNVLKKTELLASEIGQYLNTAEPATKNYISSSGGFNVVYYFLNFKDEINANKYFSKYYLSADNKKDAISRAKTYISTMDGTGMKLDASLYLLAGNIIHNYYASSGPKFQTANYYDGSGAPKDELLTDGIMKGKEYVGRQTTLLPRAGTTMRLPTGSDPLVASKIIDFSKVTTYVNKDFPELSANVVVAPGNYVLDNSSPTKGIIICKGNVIVQKAHFEGLIIAGGSVSVNISGVDLSYNQVLVKSLFKKIIDDEDLKKYFIGIDSFEGMDSDITLSDYISYRNWAKDED